MRQRSNTRSSRSPIRRLVSDDHGEGGGGREGKLKTAGKIIAEDDMFSTFS